MKSPIIITLLLIAPATLLAQPSSPPAITARGSFFGIAVKDLSSSVTWYKEKLHLRTTMTVPAGPGTNGIVVLEGDGLIVELLQADKGAPHRPDQPTAALGFVKAGLMVDAFDDVIASLRARKVEIAFGPYPAHDGQRANAIIRDNDGNLIQLFAR